MRGGGHVSVETGRAHSGALVCVPSPSRLSPSRRLQDLTVRDLEKQEREQAANSLEAFIFETQVGGWEAHLPWALWGSACEPAPRAAACPCAPP